MIKYEGIEKKFFYNIEDLNKILNSISNVKFTQSDYCSREEVCSLIEEVSDFLSKIRAEEKKSILERHENKEEAIEYFGQEFINKYEQILSVIDKQHAMLGLHGTHVSICPKICEEGLKYLTPLINATAVIKDNDIFHKLIISNDDEVIQMMKEFYYGIEEKKENMQPDSNDTLEEYEEKVNIEHVLYKIDEFVGIFNSMTMDYENGITDERYKYLLQQISQILSVLKKAISLIRTQEEIIAEQSRFSFFDAASLNTKQTTQISDFRMISTGIFLL